MRERLPRLKAARDAGVAVIEYVVAIALACLLAGGVVVSFNSRAIASTAERAICLVLTALGAGSCSSEQPQPPTEPPFDPKPKKCKMGEHTDKISGEIKIGFFKFGENAALVETVYSDETVTFTATDGAELGLTGGTGAKFDVGKLQRAEKIDFGGGIKFDYGSTWTFKDAEEAKAMREQLGRYLYEQEMLRHDSDGGFAIGLAIGGATEPPKPPNLQVSTFEVKVDAGVKVGLSLPFDPSDKDAPKLGLSELGMKFGKSGKWTQIKDAETGSTTWTTAGESTAQANGTLGPMAGELKGILGSSLAITRDKDGKVTKVTVVSTREGKATSTVTGGQKDLGGAGSDADSASKVTVTTTALDVTTDEQRTLVNRWLNAQADPFGAVSPETLYPDKLVPNDPFQNLMYTNAVVSNVEYNNVSDKFGFAAEVKVGVAFGVDFSLETTDSKATEANYLGTPGSDAVRPPVDFPECITK